MLYNFITTLAKAGVFFTTVTIFANRLLTCLCKSRSFLPTTRRSPLSAATGARRAAVPSHLQVSMQALCQRTKEMKIRRC